ncbi:MAG: polyphenol oxidase family protein [Candidatus Pacebacteria bacterium]|nr:polyphenol oxidase family protein [Candidatus Paceibacterota bacterium]
MQKIPHLFSNADGVAASFSRDESLANAQAFADTNKLALVRMLQRHTAKYMIVTERKPQVIDAVDALITKQRGVLLAVKVADCLPILFSHPSGIVGAIHAGRAGTTKKITQKTLQALTTEFGIRENLTVWFGPRICKECYQVNKQTDEHYDLVTENSKQVQAVFSDSQAKIIISEHCTAHHNSEWYSYRTEGKGVAMNWFVVGLL